MFGFIFNAPAWQLIAQADVMTKIVLTALFLLSVFCVWIALAKFVLFWREKSSMKHLLRDMKRVRTFEELLALGKKYQKTAGGVFLIKGLSELKEVLAENKSLTPRDIEYFQMNLEQHLEAVLATQEQYLPVLSTSAAVSPLIGLFGTVWGLVHAFVDISQSKSADIAVVAPGIAEALTTTLAGLVVAIPALVFFHYFSNELRKLEQKILVLSDRFIVVVRQTFMQ